MKLKKTATELKQDALMRKYKQSLSASQKRNKKVKAKRAKKLPYESYDALKLLTYKEFLKSKYWKFVRNLVLKRDSYKCIICKSETNLQVHHDHYKNHLNELKHLGELMTLCGKCHTEHHYAQM